jgi:hypothetical protein
LIQNKKSQHKKFQILLKNAKYFPFFSRLGYLCPFMGLVHSILGLTVEAQ